MLKKSLGLVLLYFVGSIVVAGWSLSHVLTGTVTSENAALVIVLPFAWVFGYWGVVGPLLVAHKIWTLQSVLNEYCERRSRGLCAEAAEEDLEDALTLLAVQENAIPERFARRIARLLLSRAKTGEAAENL